MRQLGWRCLWVLEPEQTKGGAEVYYIHLVIDNQTKAGFYMDVDGTLYMRPLGKLECLVRCSYAPGFWFASQEEAVKRLRELI